MAIAMIVASSMSVYTTTRIGESVEVILDHELPAAMRASRIAKTADTLASAAAALVVVTDERSRVEALAEVERARRSLTVELNHMSAVGADTMELRAAIQALTANLERLIPLVGDRIQLTNQTAIAHQAALAVHQDFLRALSPRARVLEGDAEIAQHLLRLDPVPIDRLTEMAAALAMRVPEARLLVTIETLNAQLMAAAQVQTLTGLDVTRLHTEQLSRELERTVPRLTPELVEKLRGPMAELWRVATAPDGLPALRAQEITLAEKSRGIVEENAVIVAVVGAAAERLIEQAMTRVDTTSLEARETMRDNMTLLIAVSLMALGGVAAFIHFHIDRNVISRLAWLSSAMRDVAAGRFNGALPPTGDDELGQLGAALRRFRAMAIDADRRERDLRDSNTKAEKAVAALEAVQLDLIKQARTDFLTGVANRQHFIETAERARNRAARSGKAISVLMLDLDHFKAVNDLHGHTTGDDALRAIAAACQDCLRPGDLLGRLGGEEFAALLPDAPLAGALEAAERIRATIAATTVIGAHGKRVPLTISVGVAEIVLPDEGLDQAMARADNALYAAKNGGRDQVRSAPPPTGQPWRGDGLIDDDDVADA